MKHNMYLSQLGGAAFDKRAWMVVTFVLLVVNLGLTTALLVKKNTVQTTFLPPELHQPFTLNNGIYSNAYVEQISTWFISQTLNYTPASFEYQLDTFLKHVDPSLFSQLSQTLLQEFEDIKKQNRSSMFFPQTVRVRGLSAVITGIRQIKVGMTDASKEQENWFVKLTKRTDGLVSLAEFKQVTKNDTKAFMGAL
jgi:type IV conjugative transfer system protein TraE